MKALAAEIPPMISVVASPNLPKRVGLNSLSGALSIMSSQMWKLRFIRLMANAVSCVSSGFPPTASQERAIKAGVRGSRQFFAMNSRGGRRSFKAKSSSSIVLALSATFPPLSSRILVYCSFVLCLSCILFG